MAYYKTLADIHEKRLEYFKAIGPWALGADPVYTADLNYIDPLPMWQMT